MEVLVLGREGRYGRGERMSHDGTKFNEENKRRKMK